MNPAPFVHSALAMTRERRVDTDAFHPMRTFRRHWAQAVAIASHPHTLRPLRMPDPGVSLGEKAERARRVHDGSGSTKHREPPREHREAILRLSKCCQ